MLTFNSCISINVTFLTFEGWCPHCCEPVVVQFSEEHVLDKHPEMMIPGAGPSKVMLPELKDELSPHLSDEETRSVIKVEELTDKMLLIRSSLRILASLKRCYVKVHRSFNSR